MVIKMKYHCIYLVFFIKRKIGLVLKQTRIEKGYTQEQLAKLLNTKETAISRIENHAEDIRLSTLERFVHLLEKR